MKELLNNEDQLDDLQTILDEYFGNLPKIKERIAHLFEGHSLPASPKLEAVYHAGMTAEELLHALYPTVTIEPAPQKWWDAMEPQQNEIPATTDSNELIAGEMDYDDRCSMFIAEIRFGNAHLINSNTLQSLKKFLKRHEIYCPTHLEQELISIADHLFQNFCDDDGQWIVKKSGPVPQKPSTDEQILENRIYQDFYSTKGSWLERQIFVAQKHNVERHDVAHIVAAKNNRRKIQEAHDQHQEGIISLNKFYSKIKKPAAIDKIRNIKIDGAIKT